ncbi:DNA alkylation repair enzyme [Entamoeba marina]
MATSSSASNKVHIASIGDVWTYVPPNTIVENIQQTLHENATTITATSYGIRAAVLQQIFDNFFTNHLSKFPVTTQMYFGYKFLKLPTAEEKRIGILTIVKNLDSLTIAYLPDFVRIIDNYVPDWTTCDSFSNKVLGPLVKKSDDFAHKISLWKDSGKVWRMRACCISFVNLAKVGAMTELSFEICAHCLRSSERFVQLGVGCLLREMSLMFSENVVEFITQNFRYFSREGLRYSIDKLNSDVRKKILSLGKRKGCTSLQQDTNKNEEQDCVLPECQNTFQPI